MGSQAAREAISVCGLINRAKEGRLPRTEESVADGLRRLASRQLEVSNELTTQLS